MRLNTVTQFMEALCNTCSTSPQTQIHILVYLKHENIKSCPFLLQQTRLKQNSSHENHLQPWNDAFQTKSPRCFLLRSVNWAVRPGWTQHISWTGSPTSSFTTSPPDFININNISSGLYRKHIIKSKQLKCQKSVLKHLKLKILYKEKKNLHQNFFNFLIRTRKQNLKKALKLLKLNILILLLPKM